MSERRINLDAAIMAAAHTQVGESASAAGILAGQIVARDRIIAQLRARLAAVAAVCDEARTAAYRPGIMAADPREVLLHMSDQVRAAMAEGAGENATLDA